MLLLLLISYPVNGRATEAYAEKTGRDCGYCHVDPAGGGELTASGRGYRLAVQPKAGLQGIPTHAAGRGKVAWTIRFTAGFLHLLTAFFWFGTILYVHLVLKPAYAAKGLPPAEVKIGLASMIIMAATGIVLTLYRVPSWVFFITTRFGILLMVKIGLFLTMVVSALFVVLFIGPRLKRQKTPLSNASNITNEELEAFDGSNGRPAYIAYQGKIYDVGKSSFWKDGSHMKRHGAGVDLTEILAQAPHGEDKILAMPVVGRLSTAKAAAPRFGHRQVFYFMAYFNLVLIFLITLVLALWKWW